jgi:hypothetical protein
LNSCKYREGKLISVRPSIKDRFGLPSGRMSQKIGIIKIIMKKRNITECE